MPRPLRAHDVFLGCKCSSSTFSKRLQNRQSCTRRGCAFLLLTKTQGLTCSSHVKLNVCRASWNRHGDITPTPPSAQSAVPRYTSSYFLFAAVDKTEPSLVTVFTPHPMNQSQPTCVSCDPTVFPVTSADFRLFCFS